MNAKMGDIYTCALYFILLQLTFTIDYFYIPWSGSSRGDRMRNEPMLLFLENKTNISWLGSPLQVKQTQITYSCQQLSKK